MAPPFGGDPQPLSDAGSPSPVEQGIVIRFRRAAQKKTAVHARIPQLDSQRLFLAHGGVHIKIGRAPRFVIWDISDVFERIHRYLIVFAFRFHVCSVRNVPGFELIDPFLLVVHRVDLTKHGPRGVVIETDLLIFDGPYNQFAVTGCGHEHLAVHNGSE